MSTLFVRNVTRTLTDGRRTFALRIEALTIAPGERKAIVGPSGSGKTTAMDLLALASVPDECERLGMLSEGGRWIDLFALSSSRIARIRAERFGYVLQTSGLLPFLSVHENVELPQRIAGMREPDLARRLLKALEIDVPADTMPSALSVGQRQRVAIARALAHRPHFVLADEPTAALDPVSADRVMSILARLAERQSAGIVVISHDQALMRRHGFEIVPVRYHAEDGRNVVSVIAEAA